MSISIQVFRTNDGLESLREDWARLESHPNADFDYYRAVLESMPDGVRPYVLAVYRDGRVVTILAGRIEEGRLRTRIGYVTVPGPRMRELVIVHGGLLGEPAAEECDLLMQQIVSSMRAGEADLVRFNHLREDSVLYPRVARRRRFFSAENVPIVQTHRAMILPQTEAELWARFSSKVRKNLKWQMRRFEREFPNSIRIACLGAPEELERLTADIEQIAVKTYQRGLGAGFNVSEGERARLRFKAEKGWLRAYILYVHDAPCSFWCGTLYRGTYHSDSMGYDPAFQQFSPGMHLILWAMEQCCSDGSGIRAIDFGLGDAQYKRLFGDQEWQDVTLVRFAPTLRGAALNAYRTPLLAADRLARAVLSSGAQQKIKRLWRIMLAGRKVDGAIAQSDAHTTVEAG
jgi:CelD/BcsL family acetyltransferase involved in cellulose biosynthesis